MSSATGVVGTLGERPLVPIRSFANPSPDASLGGAVAAQKPSRERIREEMSGNICRCTGYVGIVDAVEQAAQELADWNDAEPATAAKNAD